MKTDEEVYEAYCDEANIDEPYRVLFRHKVKDTYVFQFFQLRARWREFVDTLISAVKSSWRKR